MTDIPADRPRLRSSLGALLRCRATQLRNIVDQQLRDAPLRTLAVLVLLALIWVALYFLFTSADAKSADGKSSDGKAHGFVCALFARDSVLERVILRQTAFRLAAWHLARRVRTVPGTLTVIIAILERENEHGCLTREPSPTDH